MVHCYCLMWSEVCYCVWIYLSFLPRLENYWFLKIIQCFVSHDCLFFLLFFLRCADDFKLCVCRLQLTRSLRHLTLFVKKYYYKTIIHMVSSQAYYCLYLIVYINSLSVNMSYIFFVNLLIII